MIACQLFISMNGSEYEWTDELKNIIMPRYPVVTEQNVGNDSNWLG